MQRLVWCISVVLIWTGLIVAAVADDRTTCNKGTGDAAIAACTRAIASGRLRGHDLAITFSNRGIVAMRDKGDYDRAIADLTEAIGLDAKLTDAFLGRGNAYYFKADQDRAIADYSEAIRLNPKYSVVFNQRGNAYHAKGDQDRAIADYDESIRLDPKFAVRFTNRGNAYVSKGDLDRGIADYSEAIRLDPKFSTAFNGRGYAYNSKGDYDRAIADLDEAIRLNPNFALAFNNRGWAYNGKRDPDHAIADLNEAIRLDPKLTGGFHNRANAYRAKGDHDRAIADYTEAIRLDPKSALSFNNRGHSYRAKGDIDHAIADYTEAIRLDPGFAPPLSGRGLAYSAKGERERAEADFKAALALPVKIKTETWAQDTARAQLAQLSGHWIGLRVERVTAEIAEKLGLKQVRGALVAGVDDNGPARSAGIETGDVIVTFDGQDINEYRDLPRLVASTPLDRDIPTTVIRQGKEESRTVRLGARDANAPPAPVPATASTSPATPVIAERRIALVVGNSAYQAVQALPNPANDAKAVADALGAAGLSVRVVTNATHDGMIRALREFQDEADRAEWAVVYFAGHGMEIGGVNYLVPTDAHLKVDRDAQDEAVSLNRVLDAVAGARRLKLVMLDACRDNPFVRQMRRTVATRAVSRGLVRVEPEGATLVVYSAKDGEVAEDGSGDHSPFAAAFIRRVQQPGVEINRLFRQVTGDVLQATGNHQRPFVYGSVPGDDDFFFRNR